MGKELLKNFKENLKNEREKFLKVGGKVSKKFIGKIKVKPQEMFFFQKRRGMPPPPLPPSSWVSYSSFWYVMGGAANKVVSFDISNYDDTLVKNWRANITRNACKKSS